MGRLDFRHSWFFGFRDRAFRQVIKALPARSLDQGIIYFNSIVQTRIASEISIQAISSLKGALYLYHAPINLLGMALGTAAFPRFTKYLAKGRSDLFRREFLILFKAIVWLAIPIVVFSFVSREYWARIIFGRDNPEIAVIFGWLSLGIIFRTLYAIVSRFYYAQKDTLTPLIATILVLVSNVVLSYLLASRFGIAGLGMATAAVAVLEIAVLLSILGRRDRSLFHGQFLKELAVILAVGTAVAATAYAAADRLPFSSQDPSPEFLGKLFVILGLTFAIHLALSYFLRVREAGAFWRYFYRMAAKAWQTALGRRQD